MRHKLVLPVIAAVLASGVTAALAHHPIVPPDTVPPGYFTAHSQINHVPVKTITKSLAAGKIDGAVEHMRFAPNESPEGWRLHGGPVFVMVEAGELLNEQPKNTGGCSRKTYVKDQGFVNPGGKVPNRLTAGPDGAEVYLFYISPRKFGPTDIVTAQPADC